MNQFSARSKNGRYKALVLLTNGNGLSQSETRSLANMMYRNDLVDLVIPVMIDSACTERSDSDNCPNLVNLATWASPDSGSNLMYLGQTLGTFISDWNEIPRSVQSPGSIRAVEQELVDLR